MLRFERNKFLGMGTLGIQKFRETIIALGALALFVDGCYEFKDDFH